MIGSKLFHSSAHSTPHSSSHRVHLLLEKSERIDWIDAKTNRVIGNVSKKFAHMYGLHHHAAHVFILDAKNNIILQKRGKWMTLQPGKWDASSGGHVGAGESVERAAAREAWEEMHARGTLHRLGTFQIYDRTPAYDNSECITYFCMRTKTPIRYQKSEVEKIARVSPEKMNDFFVKNKCTPWMKRCWKKYSKKILRVYKIAPAKNKKTKPAKHLVRARRKK